MPAVALPLGGRTAIVTGAARGIGASIAVAFAAAGADLCLVDRLDPESWTAVVEQCAGFGVRVFATHADVGDEADVNDMARFALDSLGRLDILVNNAGILTNHRLVDMTADDFDETLRVDLRSVFLCCRAVLPAMIAAGRGRIINIASQLGLKGAPGLTHYSAAKAGVIGFTRALAREVADQGITANCIAPGPIDTPLTGPMSADEIQAAGAKLPLGRIGTPDEVAPSAVLLASDPGGNLYTGQTLGPNSGDVMP